MESATTALQVADWRIQMCELYSRVRKLSLEDPPAAHRAWRDRRDELFATHPATPLLAGDRAAFTGLPVADYDPGWRFECAIRAPLRSAMMRAETATDGVVPFELIGTISAPEVGELDLWRLASYAGGLFLPVRDALAGAPGGTYGGGRYLLDTVKGAHLGTGRDGALIIDFNFAYNPSCTYDPAWACPLPGAGNTVSVPIPVGERYFS